MFRNQQKTKKIKQALAMLGWGIEIETLGDAISYSRTIDNYSF